LKDTRINGKVKTKLYDIFWRGSGEIEILSLLSFLLL